MIGISPLTAKKIRRFASIRRGLVSLLLFGLCLVACLGAELFINNRALLVHYNGEYFFPTYGDIIPGTTFGRDYSHETDYRELARQFRDGQNGNWVLLPPVPYNPYENDFVAGEYPPAPPSLARKHFLGTDTSGRDVLARIVYGFRIAVFFSLALLAVNYTIGA
ncbi:MAG: ABC transporter permease, partial [Desulfosudaceae bacterium]